MIWLGVITVVGLMGLLVRETKVARDHFEDTRKATNRRVRDVHASANNVWYPHRMADGSVRCYRVTDEHALDL